MTKRSKRQKMRSLRGLGGSPAHHLTRAKVHDARVMVALENFDNNIMSEDWSRICAGALKNLLSAERELGHLIAQTNESGVSYAATDRRMTEVNRAAARWQNACPLND